MRSYLILSAVVLFLASCSKFSKIQKSTDYDYKLSKANEYYEKKKYNYAIQLYEELFPVFKGTEKFEDLYYNFAYSFYNMRDYLSAENYFKGFLDVFPTSSRAEEVDFMRAYCYYKQSPKVELDQANTRKAIGMLQMFINTHPGSPRIAEANKLMDECREKLETKEFKSAELYYNVGQFKAAAIAFSALMNEFPDSYRSEEYKLLIIRSYYEYAQMSVEEKRKERFEQVISECNDFTDRFPESKLLPEAKRFLTLSQNNINATANEQVKKTTGS
jgi:outer membrane protein assembly factor BamD